MSKFNLFLSSLAALAVVVVLTGCPAGEDSAPPVKAEESKAAQDHDHDGDDHAGHDHD